MSKNLESIGNGVFSTISHIVIPASVTKIGKNTFSMSGKAPTITFEDPEGWWIADSVDATEGTPIDVSDPSVNVKNIKSGGPWRDKYLRKGSV